MGETPTYSQTNTLEPTTLDCIVCDDKESTWQIQKGLDCATDTIRINKKCNKDNKWIAKKWCRLSCYKAGNGYPGDVCCDEDPDSPTNTPTSQPTKLPTPIPTTPPTTQASTETPTYSQTNTLEPGRKSSSRPQFPQLRAGDF